MKLKLKNDETIALIDELQNIPPGIFKTQMEHDLAKIILKAFITKLMKKHIDQKEKISISLDDQTKIVLTRVLELINPTDPYNHAVICSVHLQIHQSL